MTTGEFAKAAQFRVAPQKSYYVGIAGTAKAPYNMLPPPDLNGTPTAQSTTAPPFPSVAFAAVVEPALEQGDLALLTTGASGLASPQGVDSRVTNASTLPNGPFQLTGPTLPYDSYSGDTSHPRRRYRNTWPLSPAWRPSPALMRDLARCARSNARAWAIIAELAALTAGGTDTHADLFR
jgi:hypothetical protein